MTRPASSHAATVLLVECNQDDRGMYAEYLGISKFRTIEIDDTADALALAATADIIVTGVRRRAESSGSRSSDPRRKHRWTS